MWRDIIGRPAASKRTPHHFHHFSSNFRSQLTANHVPGGGVPTCIEDACNGRSLATTAGKLIGLVPRLTQVDDEIFVLDGGQVLYVLRPVGECFQCIGESYIHGLMDGEALRKLEDGTAEVDTIRII